MRPDQLIGRWKLVEWRTTVGEKIVRQFGHEPRGILIYTADGFMAVHIAAPDRPSIVIDPLSGNLLGGSEAERASAYSTSLAYYGRYELRGETVVHKVDLSSFPNWTGDEQVRLIAIANGELTLRTPPIRAPIGDIFSELRWVRAP